MRSKCRCSCVLQFTFRRAVSCVLHRPSSQVIHCAVLYFQQHSLSQEQHCKSFTHLRHPNKGKSPAKASCRGESSLISSISPLIGLWGTEPLHQPTGNDLALDRPDRHSRCRRPLRQEWPHGNEERGSRAPPASSENREFFGYDRNGLLHSLKPVMILPQVHLRKPCYDFYFL